MDERSSKSENFLSLQEDMKYILETGMWSDVTFIVESTPFPLHRSILAARSKYFRAMLFGNLSESGKKEIELKDASSKIFKCVMKYIYTGEIILHALEIAEISEAFNLAEMYGILKLRSNISQHLSRRITSHNFVEAFNMSVLYKLPDLDKACAKYINDFPLEVVNNPKFQNLSRASLEVLLAMDAFPAPEIEIFRAVHQWVQYNDSEDDYYSVLKGIRKFEISENDLVQYVKQTDLFSLSDIFDVLAIKMNSNNYFYNPRGHYRPGLDLSSVANGGTVLRGVAATLISGNPTYNIFSQHNINGEPSYICIKLDKAYLINKFNMWLYDHDLSNCKYYIEVSVDEKNWKKVIDRTNHLSRSRQILHFGTCAAQYIKIVGTFCSVGQQLRVVSFGTFLTEETPWLHQGLSVPITNVATPSEGAVVIEGTNPHCLLDGIIDSSTSTYHQVNNGSIIVQLAQPYWISSMRLLLYNGNNRRQRYYIETSTDNVNWEKVWDKSEEDCQEWQDIKFPYKLIAFVKIVGVWTSAANNNFCCISFECPSSKVEVKHPEEEEAQLEDQN